MRGMLVIASIAAAAWLSGCGENCQTTCTHVYGEAECNHGKDGVKPADEVDTCVERCEAALSRPGDNEVYDPTLTPAGDDSVTWDDLRDLDAAAWMDCVWEKTQGNIKQCDEINPRLGNAATCGPI